MSHSTQGLHLYNTVTDGKIGTAVLVPKQPLRETDNYYEYVDWLTFRLSSTDKYETHYYVWRIPKANQCFWQFPAIKNNGTGLVTIDFHHIMNGLYPNINSVHRAKIGGSIVNNQLLAANIALTVVVTKINAPDSGYTLSVNNGQFVFEFNPDALRTLEADEVDFVVS
jgi:hypothetical protein